MRALASGLAHDSVDADCREHQRREGKAREQCEVERRARSDAPSRSSIVAEP